MRLATGPSSKEPPGPSFGTENPASCLHRVQELGNWGKPAGCWARPKDTHTLIHTHKLTLMCADTFTLTLICIHTYRHIHTLTQGCSHMCTLTHSLTYAQSPTHIYTLTRTRACALELTRVFRQTHNTCRLAQSDAHMCMCTLQTHTSAHSHTRTNTQDEVELPDPGTGVSADPTYALCRW